MRTSKPIYCSEKTVYINSKNISKFKNCLKRSLRTWGIPLHEKDGKNSLISMSYNNPSIKTWFLVGNRIIKDLESAFPNITRENYPKHTRENLMEVKEFIRKKKELKASEFFIIGALHESSDCCKVFECLYFGDIYGNYYRYSKKLDYKGNRKRYYGRYYYKEDGELIRFDPSLEDEKDWRGRFIKQINKEEIPVDVEKYKTLAGLEGLPELDHDFKKPCSFCSEFENFNIIKELKRARPTPITSEIEIDFFKDMLKKAIFKYGNVSWYLEGRQFIVCLDPLNIKAPRYSVTSTTVEIVREIVKTPYSKEEFDKAEFMYQSEIFILDYEMSRRGWGSYASNERYHSQESFDKLLEVSSLLRVGPLKESERLLWNGKPDREIYYGGGGAERPKFIYEQHFYDQEKKSFVVMKYDPHVNRGHVHRICKSYSVEDYLNTFGSEDRLRFLGLIS